MFLLTFTFPVTSITFKAKQMICPVCGENEFFKLIYSAERPLAAVDLPRTREESLSLSKYPMNMYECLNCGHVHNSSFFDVAEMYDGAGCTMYNNGELWKVHIFTVQQILNEHYWFDSIVEIGAGDGSFLSGIRSPNKVAYEPSEDYHKCVDKGITTHKKYFNPSEDMPSKESLLIMRHVLEHLQNPKEFIEAIVENATTPVSILIEVPCIEKAIEHKRVEDWVYEHVQHFTETSLGLLMEKAGWQTQLLHKRYGGEVLVYLGSYTPKEPEKDLQATLNKMKAELDSIREEADLVFWGGAGKSATFLHEFAVSGDTVVDSDERKVGRYVPGLDLEIKEPGWKEPPVIVVTTAWRANDIVEDIKKRELNVKKVLAYVDGELVEIYKPGEVYDQAEQRAG